LEDSGGEQQEGGREQEEDMHPLTSRRFLLWNLFRFALLVVQDLLHTAINMFKLN
jgi:hypothetical protein